MHSITRSSPTFKAPPSGSRIAHAVKPETVKDAPQPSRRKTPADFRKSADIFKALGNANRLLIVDALSKGERCVAELTALVGLDISTVSNHLAVLRSAGLVGDERRGTHVFYSLRNPCVLNIFCCLDAFHAGDAE